MFDIKGPALWTLSLIHDADKTADEIIKAIDEEIARLQSTPVTKEELDLALVKQRSRLFAEYEQFVGFGRANLLAAFALFDDDPGKINRLEDEFRKVTPELIQKTAKEYLRPDQPHHPDDHPERKGELTGAQAHRPAVLWSSAVGIRRCCARQTLPAISRWSSRPRRIRPREAGGPAATRRPRREARRRKPAAAHRQRVVPRRRRPSRARRAISGCPSRSASRSTTASQVALVQWGNMPKVRVHAELRTGNAFEKANEVWLADLTGNLMREGTTTRTATRSPSRRRGWAAR